MYIYSKQDDGPPLGFILVNEMDSYLTILIGRPMSSNRERLD